MFGSGVAIGTAVGTTVHRHRIIPKGHRWALVACSVGAVGSTMPRSAVWLIVTTTTPATVSPTAGCALPFKFIQ